VPARDVLLVFHQDVVIPCDCCIWKPNHLVGRIGWTGASGPRMGKEEKVSRNKKPLVVCIKEKLEVKYRIGGEAGRAACQIRTLSLVLL